MILQAELLIYLPVWLSAFAGQYTVNFDLKERMAFGMATAGNPVVARSGRAFAADLLQALS
ncbi:MAG: hypothetical protein HQM06_12520 [Magnetococcales bacterium]|nr:hypothetical protein [Magnetococcales bacterium]